MKRYASHTVFLSSMPFDDYENTYVSNIFNQIKKEKRFIDRKLRSIVYRELYLAYLTIRVNVNTLNKKTLTNVVMFHHNESKFDLLHVSYFANDFIKDIRDLVSLSLCSKQLNQHFTVEYIDSTIMNNFQDIVENVYKLNFVQLNNILLEVKGVISGSTILQCFYGNSKMYYDSSDLDIYICESEVENTQLLVSYLTNSHYTLQVFNNGTNENSDLIHLSFSYQLGDSIRQVQSFKHSECSRIVQLITVVRNENSYVKFGRYVTSKFDISLLRNYWNGEYITTSCLRDIMSKSGSISQSVLSLCSYDNYFNSSSNHCNIQRYFESKTTVQLRALKYEERGFKIVSFIRTSLFF